MILFAPEKELSSNNGVDKNFVCICQWNKKLIAITWICTGTWTVFIHWDNSVVFHLSAKLKYLALFFCVPWVSYWRPIFANSALLRIVCEINVAYHILCISNYQTFLQYHSHWQFFFTRNSRQSGWWTHSSPSGDSWFSANPVLYGWRIKPTLAKSHEFFKVPYCTSRQSYMTRKKTKMGNIRTESPGNTT